MLNKRDTFFCLGLGILVLAGVEALALDNPNNPIKPIPAAVKAAPMPPVVIASPPPPPPSFPGGNCVRTTFQTQMYKQACMTGGQMAAKDAAKAFNKEHQIKSCKNALAGNVFSRPTVADRPMADGVRHIVKTQALALGSRILKRAAARNKFVVKYDKI